MSLMMWTETERYTLTGTIEDTQETAHFCPVLCVWLTLCLRPLKLKNTESNDAHLNGTLESEQVEHEEATLTHDIEAVCV